MAFFDDAVGSVWKHRNPFRANSLVEKGIKLE
jgi:hypothetical protein